MPGDQEKRKEATPTDPAEHNWIRKNLIARGSFGEVYLAENGHGKLAAVKVLSLAEKAGEDGKPVRQGSDLEVYVRSVKRELLALRHLGEHPHIVAHYKAMACNQDIQIFMEYCPGGSLRGYLQNAKETGVPLAKASEWLGQVVQGVCFIHRQSLIHRDIKAANVLLDEKGVAKLADFGAAAVVSEESRKSCVGSVLWMAPEVLSGRGHKSPADIWSIGCLALELLTGQLPYAHYATSVAQVVDFILNSFDIEKAIPKTITDPAARDFIKACMDPVIEKRATAVELAQHPFITGVASGATMAS